jgi:hypothetical protein
MAIEVSAKSRLDEFGDADGGKDHNLSLAEDDLQLKPESESSPVTRNVLTFAEQS